MNKFDIWKKLMHKNAINMLEGVKKILLWRIFERNLAKFFCGAFLSTFWPNCGAFRRKIISHTALKYKDSLRTFCDCEIKIFPHKLPVVITKYN